MSVYKPGYANMFYASQYPKEVISDRGLHNRGSFAKSLSARGIQVINVGVEAPEQLGRVERHGGILKSMVLKVASDLGVSGIEEMKAVVAQCVGQKNSMSRTQGFSPMQWVLGRSPREPGTVIDEESWSDLGSLQLATDESHEFGKMCKIREAARHAFVKADMGSRVSRAILRKAAPVSKEYQWGDLVCYKTQQGGWSTASRVIGFDGPKIVWVIHRGVPVCVGLVQGIGRRFPDLAMENIGLAEVHPSMHTINPVAHPGTLCYVVIPAEEDHLVYIALELHLPPYHRVGSISVPPRLSKFRLIAQTGIHIV